MFAYRIATSSSNLELEQNVSHNLGSSGYSPTRSEHKSDLEIDAATSTFSLLILKLIG